MKKFKWSRSYSREEWCDFVSVVDNLFSVHTPDTPAYTDYVYTLTCYGRILDRVHVDLTRSDHDGQSDECIVFEVSNFAETIRSIYVARHEHYRFTIFIDGNYVSIRVDENDTVIDLEYVTYVKPANAPADLQNMCATSNKWNKQ